jgi:hypothetical protein
MDTCEPSGRMPAACVEEQAGGQGVVDPTWRGFVE